MLNPAILLSLLSILPEVLDLVAEGIELIKKSADPETTEAEEIELITDFVMSGYKALDKQMQLPDALDHAFADFMPGLVKLLYTSLDLGADNAPN